MSTILKRFFGFLEPSWILSDSPCCGALLAVIGELLADIHGEESLMAAIKERGANDWSMALVSSRLEECDGRVN
ncbi:MAG: hypothetical protein CL693_12120 [Cellvibrionaceae bacterium]|nr:hypothetical protein [Cellvibrionaceae bacterium]